MDRTLSPLTPSTPKSPFSDTIDRDVIHDLSQSPFQDLPALSVSPRSPLQALPPPPEAPEVIQEQLLDGPRYSLRRRKAAQLKPYTVDQLKYKQALRANPDAIVKFKNLALRNHHHPEDHYEEDGETQKDAYIDDGSNDEDGDWEERERRRHQRHEDARRRETPSQALSERQQIISYPEILQDLSSTDEEEANEKHTLSKEARKIAEEREMQWKIQKKEERRRREQEQRHQQLLKPKPFPTFNRKPSNTKAPSDVRSTLEDVCYFYANVSIFF